MPVTLYYAPLACSLASHIALKTAKIGYKLARVDLATKKTEDGEDFHNHNPTGTVPTLKLEDGQILTQSPEILGHIGTISKHPGFYFEDASRQAQLREALSFGGDLHQGVGGHIFANLSKEVAHRRLGELEAKLPSKGYLLGTSEPSTADIYAAVVINWTKMKEMDISAWPKSANLHKTIFESAVAQEAIKEETSSTEPRE